MSLAFRRDRAPAAAPADELTVADFMPEPGLPYSILITGPWGSGKTSLAVGLSRVELESMHAAGLPWRVWSNIPIAFAERCGPAAVRAIIEHDPELHDLTFVLDESPTVISNARGWNSQIVQGFRRWHEQLRKRNVHLIGTTISALEVDSGYARLLDLVIRTKLYGDGRMLLHVHDHMGRHTGRQQRRAWPPQPGDEDATYWWHGHPDLIDGQYDSGEIVLPYTGGPSPAEVEALAAEDAQAQADRDAAAALWMRDLEAKGEIELRDWKEAQAHFPDVRQRYEWQRKLEAMGWRIERRRRLAVAVWEGDDC